MVSPLTLHVSQPLRLIDSRPRLFSCRVRQMRTTEANFTCFPICSIAKRDHDTPVSDFYRLVSTLFAAGVLFIRAHDGHDALAWLLRTCINSYISSSFRERDTTDQLIGSIDEVIAVVIELVQGTIDWDEALKRLPRYDGVQAID